MIEITAAAKQQLDSYFEGKEVQPIRVYLASGGWAGPKLSLALDELHDDDEKFESQGFEVVIEKSLFANTGDIRIDMTYYGFTVDSQNPVGAGGGCSGGSCSTSGCGH